MPACSWAAMSVSVPASSRTAVDSEEEGLPGPEPAVGAVVVGGGAGLADLALKESRTSVVFVG